MQLGSDRKIRFAFFQVGPGIGPITNNNFRFAKVLMRRGHDVHLVGTLVGQHVRERAPAGMRVFSLGASNILKSVLPMAAYLRAERPNVVLASGPTLHVLMGVMKRLFRFKVIVVARTHVETSIYMKERPRWNSATLTYLLSAARSQLDHIVATSRGSADDMADLLQIDRSAVSVLFNPAVDDDVGAKGAEPVAHRWIGVGGPPVIVCVARLAPQKALDVLLKAFAAVVRVRDARLIVLGEGPDRAKLQRLAEELEVADKVDLHGAVLNPYAFLAKADLFALSSEFEGFANVIVEALACGCPVVSTDARSGPREILDGGRYGRLVPVGDFGAMGQAILQALAEEPDRARLMERAKRFHVDEIIKDLSAILNEGGSRLGRAL
jgi:glycosyltransferase involved in cell wall biosynthesis